MNSTNKREHSGSLQKRNSNKNVEKKKKCINKLSKDTFAKIREHKGSKSV